MKNNSMNVFSKISWQMDKLSNLINQQEIIRQQLQTALLNPSPSLSSSEDQQNLDVYFKQYDNPTTKSLPFHQEDSETVNTIYRKRQFEESYEVDKDQFHDDKSTVILAATKNADKKHHNSKQLNHKESQSHLKQHKENKINKKNWASMKKKKEIGTSSMPAEVYASVDFKGKHKKDSNSRHQGKIESPSFKANKIDQDHANSRLREFKGTISKVSKIDKEELTKLQEKKAHKRTQLSSNRRKTKRELHPAKSASNIVQKTGHAITSITHKTIGAYSSSKGFQHQRRQGREKIGISHEWQKTNEKAVRKLNRVNICKLQENIKKTQQKKSKKEAHHKTYEKCILKESPKRLHGLKLHFTEEEEQTEMQKLIQEKSLNKEYEKQTAKYLQAANQIDNKYFKKLIKECRETSQQAIFKLKLVILLVYFFDQFSKQAIITYQNHDPSQDLFEQITEEEIIQVLLHPTQLRKLMEQLPYILLNGNVLSAQRTIVFTEKLSQVNDELDQQLEYFLLKKTPLFTFVHSLSEYITFLMDRELVRQTKRSKVIEKEVSKKMEGFYSNRSKRDQHIKRYLKKKEGKCGFGLRCDSDRKITFDEDEGIVKGLKGYRRKEQSLVKGNQSKKLFK